MARRLTEKQRRFAEKYLELGNATQAAIEAGYSERTAAEIGSENLRKPQILAYYRELRSQVEEKVVADASWIRGKLVELVDAGLAEQEIEKDGIVIGRRRENLGAAARGLELLGKFSDVQAFRDQIEVTRRVRIIDLTGDPTDEEENPR